MKRLVLLFICVLLVGGFSNISHGGIFTKFGRKESTRIERQTVGDKILANSGDTDLIPPEGSATREASKIFPNGVHLEAPEGDNMEVIRFLFEVNDPTAVAIKVSVQYKGTRSDSSNGKLIFVYAEKADKQEVIGDQNDLAKDYSVTESFIADPASRFINSDGLMEIHIVVSNGQTLDIGTVSVEGLQEKPVEVRKVVEYKYYPVDYREDIFSYYYVGPRYCYSDSVIVVYRDYWVLDSYRYWRRNCGYRYTRPVQEIYYLTSPAVYHEAHYVPAYHYDGDMAPKKWAKVSERRMMAQEGKALQRIRSVDGDSVRTKSNHQGKGNSGDAIKMGVSADISNVSKNSKRNLIQDSDDRRKTELNRQQVEGSGTPTATTAKDNPGLGKRIWRGAKQAGGAVASNIKNTVKDTIVVGTNHGSYGTSNPVANPAPSRGISNGVDVSQKHRSVASEQRTQPASQSQQAQAQPAPARVETSRQAVVKQESSSTTKKDDEDKDKKPASSGKRKGRGM